MSGWLMSSVGFGQVTLPGALQRIVRFCLSEM